MVAKYVRKLEEGTMNINEVPKLWSEKVRKQIEADGYTINEDGTVVKNDPETDKEKGLDGVD